MFYSSPEDSTPVSCLLSVMVDRALIMIQIPIDANRMSLHRHSAKPTNPYLRSSRRPNLPRSNNPYLAPKTVQKPVYPLITPQKQRRICERETSSRSPICPLYDNDPIYLSNQLKGLQAQISSKMKVGNKTSNSLSNRETELFMKGRAIQILEDTLEGCLARCCTHHWNHFFSRLICRMPVGKASYEQFAGLHILHQTLNPSLHCYKIGWEALQSHFRQQERLAMTRIISQMKLQTLGRYMLKNSIGQVSNMLLNLKLSMLESQERQC